ncbi:hypothetical protein D9613_002238 [Agrocybe pediades]|uniref:dCMP deaminase n=1 Tax=Agrocybe pediades TaxID=84607 RepID=A0A8H4R564_9AGAR|nr:hypothetical protein D9613_002238 [Agrocybe pediades]
MFVAIVGTRCSGKSSIEDYLVTSKGFTCVRIIHSESTVGGYEENFEVSRNASSLSPLSITIPRNSKHGNGDNISKHLSFLSMSPLPSPAPTTETETTFRRPNQQTLCFSNHAQLLKYVTANWRTHFVTTDLNTRELIEPFVRRPFFLLLRSDAPLLSRYDRSRRFLNISLEDFIEDDDRTVFGRARSSSSTSSSLQNIDDLVNVRVVNTFSSLQGLHLYLDGIDLLDPEHVRPSWDAYFMTLASLASRRSNCMKRRVGAVLVRENRVLATG